MFEKLLHLKERQYYPKIIFDIGAHKGNWTVEMLKIFKSSKYFLFEAINYEELNKFENYNNISIHKNIILNDTKKEVDWYELKNTGDTMFKENTGFFKDVKSVKKSSIDLDSYLKENNIIIDSNLFIKIDCQGAEIPIIKGSKELIDKTDFFLLEIPFFGKYNKNVGTFKDHISYMKSIGFIPFDIIDTHLCFNYIVQVDVLFININSYFYYFHLKEINKTMYKKNLIIFKNTISKGDNIFNIYEILKSNNITNNYIIVDLLLENLDENLKIMEERNFIPYYLIEMDNSYIGNGNILMVFINKNHENNKIVQEKLLEFN